MTDAPRSPSERKVEYRGAPLDAEKGPGLGCFWSQMALLGVVVIVTPLSAAWDWPPIVSIVLLSTTLVLLLFVGQTVIFLLRLVAADRRAAGRRRPMDSATKTVGELEDEAGSAAATSGQPATDDAPGDVPPADEPRDGGVRE